MPQPAVPVTLGSPWFRVVESAACRVTEARFVAGDVLHAHTHDRPILAVMLGGSFETAIAGRRFDCLPDCAWTEPCEERHANFIGRQGARVLVMQPDPVPGPLFDAIGPLIQNVMHVRDPMVALDARRMLGEMVHGDRLSRLSMDALMLGMLARVSRMRESARGGTSPAWLLRVREVLHDTFCGPPSLAALAGVAGVTPTHLCHAFRSHMGTTIGEYVRRVRATWVAEQLETTDVPLSTLATQAGYFDQSHFTRECRRLLGARPAEYRKRTRPRTTRVDDAPTD
jgi:AraC-like DNA-binding protein/quercetin dioxygenase-like cupin family protein